MIEKSGPASVETGPLEPFDCSNLRLIYDGASLSQGTPISTGFPGNSP